MTNWGLMTDSIRLTRESLGRILEMIPLSRDRFSDECSRDLFLDDLSVQVGLMDRLTESLEKYITSKAWDEGTGKINLFIKEILRDHQTEYASKKIQVHLFLRKDTPNATLPDEQLRYVIKVFLQYAMSSMSKNDHLEIATKNVAVQEGNIDAEDRSKTEYIELNMTFSGGSKQIEPCEDDSGMVFSKKEKVLNLDLSFAKNIVEIRGGQLMFLHPANDSTTTITLRLPIRK